MSIPSILLFSETVHQTPGVQRISPRSSVPLLAISDSLTLKPFWIAAKPSRIQRQVIGLHFGMILPVFKLGTLALKTLCKPIGNRIKKEAGLHPRFRQHIVNIAQANHRFTTTLQRRIYGRATDVAIRPLNEEKAVQAAADLVGELFVFSVAGAAVVFEVQRSSRSEARKEELQRQELELLRQRDEEVAREVEQLKHRIAELEQITKEGGLSGVFRFRQSKRTDQDTKDA